MHSYSSTIYHVLTGSCKTLPPIENFDIVRINQYSNSIIIKNNKIVSFNNQELDIIDTNLYELKVEDSQQFNILLNLLTADKTILNTFVLKNHFTYNGQYLELGINGKGVIYLNIIVLSQTQKQSLIWSQYEY